MKTNLTERERYSTLKKITEKRTAAWAADRKEKYETRSINRRFEKIICSKRYGKNGLWRMHRVLSVLQWNGRIHCAGSL